MEGFVPILIFIVVLVIKGLQAVQEHGGGFSAPGDDGWEDGDDWQDFKPSGRSIPVPQPASTSGPGPAEDKRKGVPGEVSQPSPSARVETILEQLREERQQASGRPGQGGAAVRPAQATRGTSSSKREEQSGQRKYLTREAIAEAGPREGAGPGVKTEREMMGEALSAAFPPAMEKVRRLRPGAERRTGCQ